MRCFSVIIGVFFIVDSVFSDTCTTPLGVTSNCISLYNCPEHVAAFQQRPLSSHAVNFLRQSQCGFDRRTPLVCCGPIPSAPSSSASTTPKPRPQQIDSSVDPPVRRDSLPEPRGTCGIDRSDRIFGGTITDLDEFVWMALLGYQRISGKGITYQCGGVLFNHRYVLTAAHCVTGEITRVVGDLDRVRLGEYDTQSDVDCLGDDCADPVQEIKVHSAYPHPGYSDGNTNRQDDIALVRLAKRVQYTDFIQPICLPDHNTRLPVGTEVFVAGWGKTLEGNSSPIKLKLGLPIYDKSECFEKFKVLNAILTDRQICAGGVYKKDACRGDSGGPLMRKVGEVWESVAVVSFGRGCGRDDWPVLADDDEQECVISFSDVVEECDGFDNDFAKLKGMSLGYVHTNVSAVSLSGTISLMDSIDDGYQLELQISKVSGSSCNDVMWIAASNICASLKEEDTPWYALVHNLHMDECPIIEADYAMDNLLLEDGSASDFCTPEMAGEYCIQLSITDNMNNQVVCYTSYISVESSSK
ncbi:unnamed protein product [Leptosia nina]|uniref:CLIP domain-containing serine protease n=1 Tax=Leptosia nina TaxID=320188 RepID=A0AAV1IU39_9NEOP